MNKPKLSYPDAIANAFKSVQAWKSLSMVLLGVMIFETISLMWLAGQRTVILIPQHLSNAKGPVSLSLGEPFSPDYLTAVAKGDLYPLLNWTPENIDAQYGLFLGRLTPALHDVQRESMLIEAKQHREEALTQSFYITRTYVKDATVSVYGVLVRASGGREIYRGQAVYELTYTNAGNSLLLLASVTQPTNARAPGGAAAH